MKDIIDIIKQIIPIIVGALIAIVPTIVGKHYDIKSQKQHEERLSKQKMYVELISLFSKVLSGEKSGCIKDMEKEVDILRDMINMISITGSTNVVKALNDYIDTWGKLDLDNQTKAYTELLKRIRVDLKVDKNINEDFPQIGLRDININRKEG